ncbi:MAG: DUF262 domain-containing HNH endonuclease family protein [Nanoarchaeota archaeon]|nr:DUF262 domain-containing HNH endonuclease family protein [Nanoarchaeota archaeon]
MENGEKQIKDLFAGVKIFCIPPYQRSYAWEEEKQLKDFLDDLKNQKVDKNYFFGTLLFQEDGEEDGFYKISIVDGQQRLTTIVIFMKVLIDYLKEKRENVKILEDIYLKYENKIKLRLQDDDNEFFQTYILGNDKTAIINTPSQGRLLEAKRFFYKELLVLSLDQLKELREKVEHSKLLTYSVSNSAEAALIFETTNDRGKILTNLEKTKSFLMYKSYISNKEKDCEDLLNNISKRFSEIYRKLEEIKKKDPTIDEDSILQYHFIAYEHWNKKRDYQNYLQGIKSKINELILEKEDIKAALYIDEYSQRLRETFDTFYNLSEIKAEYVRNLFLLERMGIFYPLLIKTYNLDETKDKTEFLHITKLLEIFSFRILSLKIKRSNDIDTFLNSLANKFEGDFSSLITSLKDKILELAPNSLFKAKLSSTNFYKEFSSNDQNYLYWKYENYLRTSGGAKYAKMSEQEFSVRGKKFGLSVEHIASQNPKVTTSEIKFEEFTEDFKENFLNCIGNLTFDPQSANSSKGNKSVPEKNNKYFVRAPFMTQNELCEFIKEGKWTRESIKDREKKLIDFASNSWDPEKVD